MAILITNMATLNAILRLFSRSSSLCTRRVDPVHSVLKRKTLLKFIRTTAIIRRVAPTQVLMPALSPTMEEGTIVTWLKEEGDVINAGDALCEIETDKATITMDTEEEGVLAKILVPAGREKVKVNVAIALIVEEGQDYKNVSIPISEHLHSVETSPIEEHRIDQPMKSIRSLSPAVRSLIDTNNLDIKLIQASGPGGRILKGDVLRHLSTRDITAVKAKEQPVISTQPSVSIDKPKVGSSAKHSAMSVPHIRYSDIPNTDMHTTMAKRWMESKSTIPHVYASTTCVMENLQLIKLHLEEKNIKVSTNDLMVKIAGVTLKQVPEMNGIWNGSEVIQLEEIDIAVDVAVDGGIITPVLRDVANLDVSQISLVLKDLATGASNNLGQKEFDGGSFTISNLGMFGITEFLAVIKPPHTSVLAVGKSHLSFTAEEVVQNVVNVSLSCDGRVVDHDLASRWLETFKKNIESPTIAGI